MTDYEIFSLIISGITLVTVIVGLVYGGIQLKHAAFQISETRRIHQENHDWNRRLAAQEALRAYNYSLLSSPLQDVFDYLNVSEPIPLAKLTEEFANNPKLQPDLHQLLNYYEGLARGIHQSLFDEEIVKSARKNAMMMAEKAFTNYLDKRRENVNPHAWRELSSLISRWRSQDNHVPTRAQTGQ